MRNRMMKTMMAMSAMLLLAGSGASAQMMRGAGGGQGLVGTYCKKEIVRYCAGVGHGTGAVPRCLMKRTKLLSKRCNRALYMKGPGGGRGQGMAPQRRMQMQ